MTYHQFGWQDVHRNAHPGICFAKRDDNTGEVIVSETFTGQNPDVAAFSLLEITDAFFGLVFQFKNFSDNFVKYLIVLLGSPRKRGNSTILAKQIGKGAEAAGADVETLYIHGMDIKPCQARWSCQKEGASSCVIEDDMQSIYPKLVESDVWVISSPIHWFSVSTQTKLWLDRAFALMAHGEKVFQKKIAIALAYGDKDPYCSGCVNAIRTFQDAFRYVGAEIVGIVYGSALNAGEVEKNADLLAEAKELGKKALA